MSDTSETTFNFEQCAHKKECDKAIAKLKDDYEKKIEALKGEYKWSTQKALVGLWKLVTDPATIAFAVFTIIAWRLLTIPAIIEILKEMPNVIMLIVGGWVGVTILFVVFKALSKSISVAIEKAQINIQATAAWTKALNLTSDVGQALKDIPESILNTIKGVKK